MITKETAKRDLRQLNYETNPLTSYDSYDFVYQWSNERLTSVFKIINVQDKRVLCVTSSGDYGVHAILNGAKAVSCFDVNRYCKYYARLKTLMIKKLSYNEFHTAMKLDYNFLFYLKKSLPVLPAGERYFWEHMINSPIDLKLFFADDRKMSLSDDNALFNEDDFLNAKRLLGNFKTRYVDAELLSLPQRLEERFDVVFVSNIFDYVFSNGKVNRLVPVLESIVSDNGVVCDYSFLDKPRSNRLIKRLNEHFVVSNYHLDNETLNVYVKR